MRQIMAEGARKTVDERYRVSKANGGGWLRREIWVDRQNRVVSHNLAYINHLIYSGDNGRVLGYHSAHGYHHRHAMGRVTSVSYQSFEQIEACLQKEWTRLAKEARHAKH